MLAASAAFEAAPSATAAAELVGAMLTRWHYIALAAPLALFLIELRYARRLVLIITAVAALAALSQVFVDLRIRAIRDAIRPQSVAELHPADPLRRQFGALHGVSMTLLALQAITAGVTAAAGPKIEPLGESRPSP